jgi:metal transporter CNNM
VRKDSNLLLCTLLVGNVAVMSLTSILMSDLTSGLEGFFISTAALVVFGEIIPQVKSRANCLSSGSARGLLESWGFIT